MRQAQAGFTLIEIAIVLVIIGLLIGGVLKGQELINNAKVKNLANDFRGISTSVYAYQDRFRALPGDDNAVAMHVSNGTLATTPANSLGNARINGAWNSSSTSDESYLFWQHIRLAGLATGTTDTSAADYRPRNSEGGVIGISSDALLSSPSSAYPASFYVCSQGIQGRFARQIDTLLDDGNTQTGSVRVMTDNAASVNDASRVTPAEDAQLFSVCMSF